MINPFKRKDLNEIDCVERNEVSATSDLLVEYRSEIVSDPQEGRETE